MGKNHGRLQYEVGKRIDQHKGSTPYIKAPEICVEITSPSNTKGETEEKVQQSMSNVI